MKLFCSLAETILVCRVHDKNESIRALIIVPPQPANKRRNLKDAVCPFCQRKGHVTKRSTKCLQNPRNLDSTGEQDGSSAETTAAVNDVEETESETGDQENPVDNDARDLDLLDSLVIDNDKFFDSFDNEDDLDVYDDASCGGDTAFI